MSKVSRKLNVQARIHLICPKQETAFKFVSKKMHSESAFENVSAKRGTEALFAQIEELKKQ